eukprot:923791-Pleurochrysis_carterae.AAC.1
MGDFGHAEAGGRVREGSGRSRHDGGRSRGRARRIRLARTGGGGEAGHASESGWCGVVHAPHTGGANSSMPSNARTKDAARSSDRHDGTSIAKSLNGEPIVSFRGQYGAIARGGRGTDGLTIERKVPEASETSEKVERGSNQTSARSTLPATNEMTEAIYTETGIAAVLRVHTRSRFSCTDVDGRESSNSMILGRPPLHPGESMRCLQCYSLQRQTCKLTYHIYPSGASFNKERSGCSTWIQ